MSIKVTDTGAQSVDRAMALLLAIGAHGETGASLSELCNEVGITKPTGRRLLLSLIKARMVEQVPTSKCYTLGATAYTIGQMASSRFSLLEHFRSSATRVAEATGDTCILAMRQGDFVAIIARVEGSYAIRSHTLQVGQRIPMGVGSASLAMLSAMASEEVEDLIALNCDIIRKRYPENTPSIIRKNVIAARRNGYSFNPGLLFEHSWGVGVPIKSANGQIIGALSVSAIDYRMTNSHVATLVSTLKREVERVYKLR